MPSIFSKIVAGELPCHKVAETNEFLAFLDINPLSKGHTLVIPKKETDYLFDLDDPTYKGLMLFAKKVAIAIKKVIDCKRVGVAVVGFEVPHAHIHLAPINGLYDIDFSKPKLELTKEEFTEIARAIGHAFEG